MPAPVSAVVAVGGRQQLLVPHLEGEVGAALVAAQPHHELQRLPVQVMRQVESAIDTDQSTAHSVMSNSPPDE